MRFELHFTDRTVFYTKYAGGFLWGEPGQENGPKAVALPWGEMTVTRGIETGKDLGIFEGKS